MHQIFFSQNTRHFILAGVCGGHFLFNLPIYFALYFRNVGRRIDKMKYFLIIMSLVWSGISSIYAQERTPEPITKQVEKNVVLHIEEMNCQLCVYLVNKELRAVSGVISTKASMKDRKVKIVTTQDVDNQTLIQAVEKLHYSAKVM